MSDTLTPSQRTTLELISSAAAMRNGWALVSTAVGVRSQTAPGFPGQVIVNANTLDYLVRHGLVVRNGTNYEYAPMPATDAEHAGALDKLDAHRAETAPEPVRDHYGAQTRSAFLCESGQRLCARHDASWEPFAPEPTMAESEARALAIEALTCDGTPLSEFTEADITAMIEYRHEQGLEAIGRHMDNQPAAQTPPAGELPVTRAASALVPGDMVDLEDDPYATGDDFVPASEYEGATVETIETASHPGPDPALANVTVVYFENFPPLGVPADHRFRVLRSAPYYVVSTHMAGYLPEAAPRVVRGGDAARTVLGAELRYTAETLHETLPEAVLTRYEHELSLDPQRPDTAAMAVAVWVAHMSRDDADLDWSHTATACVEMVDSLAALDTAIMRLEGTTDYELERMGFSHTDGHTVYEIEPRTLKWLTSAGYRFDEDGEVITGTEGEPELSHDEPGRSSTV